MIEKVALVLVITAQRIRMYFQNHRILVKTDYSEDTSKARLGRTNDRMGCGTFRTLDLIPGQGAIKSQALADFTSALSPYPTKAMYSQWMLHVDGSSNNKSCGAGVVLKGPGDILLD